MKKKHVKWFHEVSKSDGNIVGGKGANLGEMTQAGFPVPPGFIVTAPAYFHFLEKAGIKGKIRDLLHGLDVNDSKKLEKAASAVRKLIVSSPFPKSIAKDIIDAYFSMEKGLKEPLVAVRSSATAEDLPEASFAGQQETFLNVQGEANLIQKVREAWASLFTARATFYRATNKFDHLKVGIAVPVQKMVNSDLSGIMFTLDPVTNNKNEVVIEAIFGLGELIVQGAVNPDHYVVDKKSMKVKKREAGYQERKMVRRGKGNMEKKLSKKEGSVLKMSDEHLIELAKVGKKLEKHYYFPQDIEWAIENDEVYVVQTRPVTTVGTDTSKQVMDHAKGRVVLLTGDPASPGVASGKAKVLKSAKEIHKIHEGDILVAEQTNPDFVPAMKRAVAIVAERGGRTSHAAIVSRELGIPAVVGADDATKKMKKDIVATVNGTTGEIYKGAVVPPEGVKQPEKKAPGKKLKTATKVYVNMASPDRAVEVAQDHVDGVGLLRAEFMVADIGVHPRAFIAKGKQKEFVRKLSKGIISICKAFYPRRVVYRATDFRSNEYRNLKGGWRYEQPEENPMLGFRGAARYIADAQVFSLELEALKRVRNKHKLTNLALMIPFVRNPQELLEVKKIVAASGLSRSSSFKLWMMVELPTNVVILDKFLDVGIDGVSIGSNDLTMLMLGTDRDNAEVAHDFNEMDPAVLWALKHVIKTCHKYKVTSSICGQAPSDYPELVEKLVKWGITSISVNADAIERTREFVHNSEQSVGKR